MSNDAGGTARLAYSQPNGVGLGRGMLTASPDRLIRTMEGRITSWSSGMQRRYGFTRQDARGQTSHQLLRTTFPQTLQEIEATLVHRNSWSGGLIHCHADGHPVMTANHWQMHRSSGDQVCLVTEIHSDIAQESEGVYHELADVLSALAHELGEPLTAIHNYFDAMQQDFQPGRPAPENMRIAIEQASGQIARSAGGVLLLRHLANRMRNIGSMPPDGSVRIGLDFATGESSVSP
jgi:signal transduction histidine kinase